MAVRIKNKHDTAANWTTNGTVVLLDGEIGFETNTGKFKIGDGVTTWASLLYASVLPADAYTDADAQGAVGDICADSDSISLTYVSETSITAALIVDVTPGTVVFTVGAGGVSANVVGTLDCGSSA